MMRFRVEVTFHSDSEGGRRFPVLLAEPGGYRPHLVFGEQCVVNMLQSSDYLAVAFTAPLGELPVGEAFEAEIEAQCPPTSLSKFVPDAPFFVFEWASVVAHGRILHALPHDA